LLSSAKTAALLPAAVVVGVGGIVVDVAVVPVCYRPMMMLL